MDAFLVHILGNLGKFVCLHTLKRCHFLSIQIFFFQNLVEIGCDIHIQQRSRIGPSGGVEPFKLAVVF